MKKTDVLTPHAGSIVRAPPSPWFTTETVDDWNSQPSRIQLGVPSRRLFNPGQDVSDRSKSMACSVPNAACATCAKQHCGIQVDKGIFIKQAPCGWQPLRVNWRMLFISQVLLRSFFFLSWFPLGGSWWLLVVPGGFCGFCGFCGFYGFYGSWLLWFIYHPSINLSVKHVHQVHVVRYIRYTSMYSIFIPISISISIFISIPIYIYIHLILLINTYLYLSMSIYV